MITIILQSAPYGDERMWNALRLTQSLITASIGMKANIFLTGDAVTTAKRGQKPPKGFYNLEYMLKELLRKGVNVVACYTCISARGLTQTELIDGIIIGSTVRDLANWIKESQKVLAL